MEIGIQYLQESISFHLIIGDELWHFITLYRCPNQSHDEFSLFIKHLELYLDKATTYNSFLVVVLGDFNAKSCNWCIDDKTNFEGTKTDTLASQKDLHQIIKELTHHSLALTYFLHQNLGQLWIQVCMLLYMLIVIIRSSTDILLSTLYKSCVHYKHANMYHSRKTICSFNWKRSFANKDVMKRSIFWMKLYVMF